MPPLQQQLPPPPAAPPPPPAPVQFPSARAHLWDRTAAGATMVIDLQVRGALPDCWQPCAAAQPPLRCAPSPPCHPSQNLRLHLTLAPDAWPLLQRLQRGGAAAAALQAHLLPGSSTSRGLHVQLAAAASARSAAVPVAVHPAGPAAPDSGAAATAAQRLEVAASRAPGPASLAHLLAAATVAQADGAGGLVLAGTAVAPAAILDLRPLLPKRLAATPLAQRLQEQLRSPVPPVEEASAFGQVPGWRGGQVARAARPPCMPAHLPSCPRCAGWLADHGPRPQPDATGGH